MARKRRVATRHGGPAGWDDLLDVPEDFIGEIVAGELVMVPRPGIPHAKVASDLGGVLFGPFRLGQGGPGGWVILHEPRLRFGQDIRVPDLAGWRAERFVGVPRTGPLAIVPDWIAEVLSPSTEEDDRTDKRERYARAGVPWLWLLDPRSHVLEAYRLEAERGGWLLVGSHAGRVKVRVPPFDAVELDLGILWPEGEPDRSE